MPVAYALGNTSHLVSLGQGAFFYSALFLPTRQRTRLLMGSIILALGLGFYLIGGNVVPNPWEAILFTFFVAVNLSFLSGWRIGTWQLGGSLALTFIMIYTAGLNTGSPAEASGNFLALAGVMAWAAAVSLLPFWRPIEPPPGEALTLGDTVEQGVRTGIGMSLALFVSYLFGFLSFGWAPSAVGHIVRYDEKVTHLRAWARFLGTIGGATLALLALVLFHNLTALIYAALVFGSLNGLFKAHRIGQMPFFYTATIILLYSAFDIDSGPKIGVSVLNRDAAGSAAAPGQA